jgi:hypothetical protein
MRGGLISQEDNMGKVEGIFFNLYVIGNEEVLFQHICDQKE